ncbi:TPA: hypothetical protein ACWX1I_003164 [Elizabethkingia anophelis]
MKEKENNKQKKEINSCKQEYIPPVLDVIWIEMEQGIAAGSAKTSPTDIKNEIKEDWEDGSNVDRTMDW